MMVASSADNYDPTRYCEHRPDDVYTREPCSCGRELWPPRGRGRGESLSSPRRIEAKVKALHAMELHCLGVTYDSIARQLGYRTRGGAWRAVQRIRDQHAAWERWKAEQRRWGGRPRDREPTRAELEAAIAAIEDRYQHTLDKARLEVARSWRRWRASVADGV